MKEGAAEHIRSWHYDVDGCEESLESEIAEELILILCMWFDIKKGFPDKWYAFEFSCEFLIDFCYCDVLMYISLFGVCICHCGDYLWIRIRYIFAELFRLSNTSARSCREEELSIIAYLNDYWGIIIIFGHIGVLSVCVWIWGSWSRDFRNLCIFCGLLEH